MITLLLADDHPVTRAGIRTILSQAADIQVVGEAQDGIEAMNLVAQLRPQILLLDLIMPGPRPAELEKWVRANYPETITLILTAHGRDAYLAKMMEAGVAGYITKDKSSERLIDAIRRAARGEIVFTEEQNRRMLGWHENAGNKWDSLTAREREVLPLLLQGLDNAGIAEALGIQPKTVAQHMTKILKKIGVNSRQEAIVWAHTYLSDNLE